MSHPTDVVIGQRIRAARQAKKMSQVALAEQVAALTNTPFRQQKLLLLEQGRRGLKLIDAIALSQVLGVDLSAGIAEEMSAHLEQAARERAVNNAMALLTDLDEGTRAALLAALDGAR